jgi:hypothetical protein
MGALMQQGMPLATQPLDMVGGTAFGRYSKISIEETFNMMISDESLVDFLGYELKLLIDAEAPSREVFKSTRFEHLIAVIGNKVYSINDDYNISIVGSLTTSSGNVFIAENTSQQIAIVDGANLYVYNWGTNTFTTLTAAVLGFIPIHIEGMDTYLIASAKDSNVWRISDPGNALNWPAQPENVGLLQTKADNVVATIRLDRQLLVMGEVCTELWRDTGASPFPFQRDNTVSLDHGTIAPLSIAAGFGMVVWFASNEKSGFDIRFMTGGQAQDLSSDGFNHRFDQLTRPEAATALLYQEDGHVFYQITFPFDNVTYVFDFKQKKFYTLTDENLNFHIAKRAALFNNKLVFLSLEQGALYEMGTEITTYDGKVIPRIRKTKPFRLPNANRFVVPEVRITMEQGKDAAEQKVYLSLSKDGGTSFGTVVGKTLNPLGRRPNILRFTQLGSANDLTFQFRFESLDRFVVNYGQFTYYE